jgi:hypothetical protein
MTILARRSLGEWVDDKSMLAYPRQQLAGVGRLNVEVEFSGS